MGLRKSKPKVPTYDGPVQKRIKQFYNIRNCAEEIAREAVILANQFNVLEADGEKNHNVALGLAVRLDLHGAHSSKESPQFGTFLAGMSETFDEISREQAIFQKEIHDKVIDPLRKWLEVEFKRMDAEIQKLHNCTNQYERAKKNLTKKNIPPNQLMAELLRRELQLQMDVVKADLGRLRLIKDMHNNHLRDLIKSLGSYHDKVHNILEQRTKGGPATH